MPTQKRLLRSPAFFLFALVMTLTVIRITEASPLQTYVIIGTEPIAAENTITAARNQAITNSLVTAVGLAVADGLPVEVMASRYEKLNQHIYDNAEYFVQDYKVLAESRQANRYRVVVQATVSGDRIQSELTRYGILQVRRPMPAVLYFISEQSPENPMPQYWWGRNMPYVKTAAETAMTETMREQGYRIVEHGPQVQLMAGQTVADSPEITVEEAVNLALALSADVVVIGRSVAERTDSMGPDSQSYKGSMIARAYFAKTGKQIASVIKTAVTAPADQNAGSRDAFKDVGGQCVGELAALIESAWQEERPAADQILIQVAGTHNLVNFVQFRRLLTSVTGVEEVQVKELNADDAALSVSYGGKTRQLADALMLHAFETFSITIHEVTPERLKIQLIPRSSAATAQ
ncbi:MAG: hypothetical protein U5R30_18825 [Deltaproteobacteria bacterium]|nr:hypothetical protein [Deltaproteobacteria bacterium]